MGNSRRIIRPHESTRRAAIEAGRAHMDASLRAALTQPTKAELREMLAKAARNTETMQIAHLIANRCEEL